MVCRLCGAANPPQQSSCVTCGSPLEKTAERRGGRKHAEARGGSASWLLLCFGLGASLGLVVTRLRAGGVPPLREALFGLAVGGLAGMLLGTLPGRAGKILRRGWATLRYFLCNWIATRKLAAVRRVCEASRASDEDDPDAVVKLTAALWLSGERDQAEQILLRLIASGDDVPPLVHHNCAVAQAALGRTARAAEELEQVRRRMPSSTTLNRNLGLARWKLGQLAEASATAS